MTNRAAGIGLAKELLPNPDPTDHGDGHDNAAIASDSDNQHPGPLVALASVGPEVGNGLRRNLDELAQPD